MYDQVQKEITLYDQNLKFKSGKPERGGVRSEEEETTDRHDRHDRTSEGLPNKITQMAAEKFGL